MVVTVYSKELTLKFTERRRPCMHACGIEKSHAVKPPKPSPYIESAIAECHRQLHDTGISVGHALFPSSRRRTLPFRSDGHGRSSDTFAYPCSGPKKTNNPPASRKSTRSQTARISDLLDGNGQPCTSSWELLETAASFYEDLFTPGPTDPLAAEVLINRRNQKTSQ